jgi:LacI family transcriptional regulator
MKRRKRVALIIETSNEYARGLLHGIRAYIREHEPWAIYFSEQRRGEPPHWLKDFKGNGIIARIETRAIAEAVTAKGLPTVDVSAARFVPDLPWVETDNEAIAKLAAEHLLDRGLRHFGFCGMPAFNWSRERSDHFERIIRRRGHECSVYPPRPWKRTAPDWVREQPQVEKWIRSLPRPCGIMACFDIRAQQVVEVCRNLDIAVPDEIAVVGVDNDELLCDLCDPPLSSVAPDTDRTGYLAAQLLDRMMAGRKVPAEAHLIRPLGMVTRQSTDVLAVADPAVSAALRFIREHACEGIGVAAVMQHVPVSRRVLDKRFVALLGRTIHQEIDRLRIERVKDLLDETDLPLAKVAQRAGFEHVEYMTVVFKKKLGTPPSRYREARRRFLAR